MTAPAPSNSGARVTRSISSSKPPIRSSRAVGLGSHRWMAGWAPRRAWARNGPSRWAPSRRQRPLRWRCRAVRITARAWRRGATAQVTKVGQIASTPSRQSSSSRASSWGRSAPVSSGKARPRPPLICRSTPAGLSQSPCQSAPAATLPGARACTAAIWSWPSRPMRQSWGPPPGRRMLLSQRIETTPAGGGRRGAEAGECHPRRSFALFVPWPLPRATPALPPRPATRPLAPLGRPSWRW